MRFFPRLLLAAFVALSPIAALAQQPGQASGQTVTLPAAPPPAVSAPSATPPANTFVTVKDGSATISGGTIISEVLMWAALVLGAPLAGVLVALVVKLLNRLGVDVSDKDRARLKEFVENGIALAAQRARASLDGKLDVQTKNVVAVDALKYVQDHGAETLKRLGYDPDDPKAVEAIQARIAKLIADKTTAAGTVNVVTQS